MLNKIFNGKIAFLFIALFHLLNATEIESWKDVKELVQNQFKRVKELFGTIKITPQNFVKFIDVVVYFKRRFGNIDTLHEYIIRDEADGKLDGLNDGVPIQELERFSHDLQDS